MHRKIMREQFIIPIKQNTFLETYIKAPKPPLFKTVGKTNSKSKDVINPWVATEFQLEPSMCHKVLL